MGASDKSFLSGVHLLITTLAALVTAAVAVLGIAVSRGWVSGGKGSNSSATATTVAGSSATSATPQFVVDPPSLNFGPLTSASQALTITNTGTVPLSQESHVVTGANASRFSVDASDCHGPVQPGKSCRFQVTFHQAAGSSSATLVINISGGAPEAKVPITASALL